jgi:pimeloyl-ACP methyl ester carboxylesterase
LPLEDPATTWEERIAPALRVADGAVVVAHSLASGYAALLAARLEVAALVYLCPAPTGVLDVDAPMRPYRAGFPWPAGDVWDRSVAVRVMYPRLDAETAATMAEGLRPGARPCDECPISAHPTVRTRLLYASHDEFFEPAWERWLAREVLGIEPEELPTGHFPMLEAPELLADRLHSRTPNNPDEVLDNNT